MLQHYNKHELVFVGKAKDIKLALTSINNEAKQNQTLQQYLLQRLTISFHLRFK